MGEARHNPQSPQYVNPNPPRFRVGAMLDAMAVPSAKWAAENQMKDGEAKEALCPDEEMEVAIVAVGLYAECSPLIPQGQYPQGAAPIWEICRIPFKAFQKAVKDANPKVNWRKEDAPPAPQELDS